MKKPLELLAPAKDAEAGKTAINFGADAVYIGAPKFSARAAAGNSAEDIGQLISYAHRYHARVYAAFNTILSDHELEEARRMLGDLISAGIDAIIIQDMGILQMGLPPVEWHASTQTHNATPEKVRFLEQSGFRRIILARELSLEEIRGIRKATSIDLEFFVHGALCVSMSGQCYMSLASGGRSGNRGVCAQPCRKRYELKDSAGNQVTAPKHLLSLKDLDLSGHLPELAEAGISSFKIEGRLKDLNYVKNITAYYRKKLDAFLSGNPGYRKSSSGYTLFDFEPDPARTFSRGGATYFLEGRKKGITAFDTPKSTGEVIGKVLLSTGNKLEVESSVLLSNNDGLSWFTNDGELQGVKVNEADGTRLSLASPVKIKPGSLLYRNHDHRFGEMLKKSRSSRKIRIKLTFSETEEGYQLYGSDEDGIEHSMLFRREKQVAGQPEKAEALIREQLSKPGDSGFDITEVSICWAQAGFMPVSVMNGMRRDFLEAFMGKRVALSPPPQPGKRVEDLSFTGESITYLGNVSNHLAAEFYRSCGVREIEPSLEQSKDFSGKRLMTMKHCLRYEMGYCPREQGSKTFPWKEPLYLYDGEKKFRLEFDCSACKMNLYQA